MKVTHSHHPFLDGFSMKSTNFPMVFLWFSYGFPMVFRCGTPHPPAVSGVRGGGSRCNDQHQEGIEDPGDGSSGPDVEREHEKKQQGMKT